MLDMGRGSVGSGPMCARGPWHTTHHNSMRPTPCIGPPSHDTRTYAAGARQVVRVRLDHNSISGTYSLYVNNSRALPPRSLGPRLFAALDRPCAAQRSPVEESSRAPASCCAVPVILRTRQSYPPAQPRSCRRPKSAAAHSLPWLLPLPVAVRAALPPRLALSPAWGPSRCAQLLRLVRPRAEGVTVAFSVNGRAGSVRIDAERLRATFGCGIACREALRQIRPAWAGRAPLTRRASPMRPGCGSGRRRAGNAALVVCCLFVATLCRQRRVRACAAALARVTVTGGTGGTGPHEGYWRVQPPAAPSASTCGTGPAVGSLGVQRRSLLAREARSIGPRAARRVRRLAVAAQLLVRVRQRRTRGGVGELGGR